MHLFFALQTQFRFLDWVHWKEKHHNLQPRAAETRGSGEQFAVGTRRSSLDGNGWWKNCQHGFHNAAGSSHIVPMRVAGQNWQAKNGSRRCQVSGGRANNNPGNHGHGQHDRSSQHGNNNHFRHWHRNGRRQCGNGWRRKERGGRGGGDRDDHGGAGQTRRDVAGTFRAG